MGIGALIGAGIQGGASLFGASMQADASKKASAAMAAAAQRGLDQRQQFFNTTQSALTPYMTAGATAAGQLNDPRWTSDIPLPTAPLPLTQEELESTPGYQFTLGQGLKATQNSAAARGLGLSGAALKGAAAYATGLSDQTYNTRWNQRQGEFGNRQQLFADAVSNRDAGFNKLYQTAGLGASGAGALGKFATETGAGMASSENAIGSAQGAGIMGPASAYSGALTTGANALSGYLATRPQYGTINQWGSGIWGGGVPNYNIDPITGRPY